MLPISFLNSVPKVLYSSFISDDVFTSADPVLSSAVVVLLIPIPPLAEQKRIVDKIDEIFAKL